LTILGREVRLGTGYADLLAVESAGRLVIIEVKLAGNAESRRAVVGQVLSYAGYLQGLDPGQLESQVLARQLGPAGTVLAAVEADDQQYGLDRAAFQEGLARVDDRRGEPLAQPALGVCVLAGPPLLDGEPVRVQVMGDEIRAGALHVRRVGLEPLGDLLQPGGQLLLAGSLALLPLATLVPDRPASGRVPRGPGTP